MIWAWTFKKRTRNSQWADSWALARQSFEKDIFFLSHLERKYIEKVIHKEIEEKRWCSRTSEFELGITHEIFHQWQCGVIKLIDSFRTINELSWAESSIKSSGLFIWFYLKYEFKLITKQDYMFKFGSFTCQVSLSFFISYLISVFFF